MDSALMYSTQPHRMADTQHLPEETPVNPSSRYGSTLGSQIDVSNPCNYYYSVSN